MSNQISREDLKRYCEDYAPFAGRELYDFIISKADAKLQEGAWEALYKEQSDEIKEAEEAHESLMIDMRRRHSVARECMEKKCVADHGTHQSDGGFQHSNCTRCGMGEG